jgi:hypothetical protein
MPDKPNFQGQAGLISYFKRGKNLAFEKERSMTTLDDEIQELEFVDTGVLRAFAARVRQTITDEINAQGALGILDELGSQGSQLYTLNYLRRRIHPGPNQISAQEMIHVAEIAISKASAYSK